MTFSSAFESFILPWLVCMCVAWHVDMDPVKYYYYAKKVNRRAHAHTLRQRDIDHCFRSIFYSSSSHMAVWLLLLMLLLLIFQMFYSMFRRCEHWTAQREQHKIIFNNQRNLYSTIFSRKREKKSLEPNTVQRTTPARPGSGSVEERTREYKMIQDISNERY